MIATYADLKASILKWLIKDSNDPYFTDGMLDDLIYLAEAEMSRRLRVRQMREQTTFDLTAGNPSYALPSGFIKTHIVYRTGSSNSPNIEFLSSETFASRNYFARTGTPEAFYINEDSFVFGPVPSSDVNITLDYYKNIPNLSSTTTTNKILSEFPDLYLFACLKQAYAASQDDREILYEQRMEKLVNEVNKADKANAISSGTSGYARGIS